MIQLTYSCVQEITQIQNGGILKLFSGFVQDCYGMAFGRKIQINSKRPSYETPEGIRQAEESARDIAQIMKRGRVEKYVIINGARIRYTTSEVAEERPLADVKFKAFYRSLQVELALKATTIRKS
jgi:hypothetical protein